MLMTTKNLHRSTVYIFVSLGLHLCVSYIGNGPDDKLSMKTDRSFRLDVWINKLTDNTTKQVCALSGSVHNGLCPS